MATDKTRKTGRTLVGAIAVPYQTPLDVLPDRKDHIWIAAGEGDETPTAVREFKCVSCGAIATVEPPPYPTDPEWRAVRFDRLTDAERELCPREK